MITACRISYPKQFCEKSKNGRRRKKDDKKNTPLIVATTFCLHQPTAVYALRLDQYLHGPLDYECCMHNKELHLDLTENGTYFQYVSFCQPQDQTKSRMAVTS